MVAIPAGVVALQLANQAEQLVCELFPDARYQGSELRWRGADGAWWTMKMRGPKRGVWFNTCDPQRMAGDALELVHHSLFPHEQGRRESIAWSAAWLGLDTRTELDPERALELRRLAMEATRRRELEQREHDLRQHRRALALYLDEGRSQPLPLTSEVANYLRNRIGVTIEELSGIPRALRFSRSIYYSRDLMLPAMLAPIMDPRTRRQIATHVTYLEMDRDGQWRKADVTPAKKVFGGYAGGVIPLLRGASGQPMAKAPDGDTILIGEGIENSLAASLLVDGDPRVVACVAVGNLPGLELPDAFTTVILAYDRDGENEGVRRARARASERFVAEGRTVQRIKPPVHHKDFADYTLNGDPDMRA